MHKALLVAASLLAVMISGCATDGDSPQGTLVRKVTLQFDDEFVDSFDDVEATFVYTHSGDPVNVADVTVEITEKDFGRIRDLSKYTSLTTLQAGDTVSLEGLPALAEVIIRGDSLLGKRSFSQHDWYFAEGDPVPLAGQGSAKWDWSMNYGASFGADSFTITDEYESSTETTRVEDLSFLMSASTSGSISLTASDSIVVTAPQTGTLDMEASADVNITTEETHHHSADEEDHDEPSVEYEEFSAELDIGLTVETSLSATFGLLDRHLTGVDAATSVTVDGDATASVSDVEFDFEDFMDETLPYEMTDSWSETFEITPQTAAEAAQIMQFYGTDLEIGDSIDVIFGDEDDGLRYQLIASKAQTTSIGGKDVPTIFLAGTVNFFVEGLDLGDLGFGAVITKTGLPVQAAWGGDLDLPFEDLVEYAELIDEDVPEGFDAAASADFKLDMVSMTGDLRTAPWLFMAAPFVIA